MYFGQTPNYSIFNPPDYFSQMITDPTQVPYQLYPYGGGGASPYGPYPGFYYGQRPMSSSDARRMARDRQRFMEQRAKVSEDPAHRYLTSTGRLGPRAASAMRAAKAAQPKPKKPAEIIKSLQKRVLTTVLLGSIISALLK